MIAENVILIVKAPNQQIEDQNIECQSSWTVRQLKGHLSEVYPSKPRTDEQKIIYSGQLLDDNTVLKDVLRTYESQLGHHTMHLVCAPSKTMPPPTPEEPKDGLRQRNVPAATAERERPTETATRPEMRQNDQNHTVEMQNYLSSFVNNYGRVPPYPNYPPYNIGEGYLPVPNDQASLANHMLMMQQAYMRYMQQYANMWQATTDAAAAPPAEPPAPPPQDPPAEEEEHHQDWLDHVYSASRLAILFSLIYLYGSPARLLLVIIITAAAYLHQIGFFRELFVNDDNANRARNQQPEPQQPQPQQQQPQQQQPQPQPQQQQPQPQPQPAANRVDANQTEEPRSPSFLAITWMVFTTFFTSLIPDTNQ